MRIPLLRTLVARPGRRWWLLAGAGATFTLYLALWLSGQAVASGMSPRQAIGTLLMLSVMPCYFFFCMAFLASRTQEIAARHARLTAATRLNELLYHLPGWASFALLIGALFGADQNGHIVVYWRETGDLRAPDVTIFVANTILWMSVAIMLCWRIPLSITLSKLGRDLPFNLYDQTTLLPLRKLATYDLMVVVGALAFMPLQALDAEFRLVNYFWGMLIGPPVAALLFLLPLSGIRKRMQALKQERLEALQLQLKGLNPDDTATLESVCAHMDRVRGMSNWPVDLKLVTRLISYLIIPPLAWVAAAVVEGWVERL